jgi:hypothetical protein
MALRIEWTEQGVMVFSWCGATHASSSCHAKAWACAIRIGGTPVWESDVADDVACASDLAAAAGGIRRGARVSIAWGARGASADACLTLRSKEHGVVVVRLAVR